MNNGILIPSYAAPTTPYGMPGSRIAAAMPNALAAANLDPRSIPNLAAWWDCSDPSRYTLVNGLVSAFTDSTGTYTITQSTAASRPSISSLNGRSAFGFDGSSTALFNTSPVTPWGTYFWAARSAVLNGTARCVFANGTNSPNLNTICLSMSFTGTNLWAINNRVSGGSQNGFSGGTLTANVPVVGSGILPNSTTLTTMRVNGVPVGSAGLGGTSNSAGVCLGARLINGAPSGIWNGVIGEVIWYSRTLTPTEIALVETYLSARWGITF